MIEAIRGKGVNRAKVVCDDCGREDVVTCGYIRGASPKSTVPNAGQINQKMQTAGWDVGGNKMRCPSCAAHRRAFGQGQCKEGEEMIAAAAPEKTDGSGVVTPADLPPREPGYRMIGAICDMLDIAYDRSAKRYKNPGDSDRSIADAIGEGRMWGWVARVRDAEYGPDGRGAEIAEIRADLAKAIREVDERSNDAIAEFRKLARDFETAAAALKKRVDKLDPSIGQKVAS